MILTKEFTEPSLNISQFDEDLGSITESNLQDMYKISKTRQWDTWYMLTLIVNQLILVLVLIHTYFSTKMVAL